MLIATLNQRTMKGLCSAALVPLPQALSDPAARAAAISQLCHLPWGHPHAVELRRLFRQQEGER